MKSSNNRIAIVGAGFCGMASIAFIKEEGLEPVCFEKTSDPGGTWCYREQSQEGVGSTMSTTIINHSKEMGAISNFPPPAEFSNYMRHHELLRYFQAYWLNHDCYRHVTFKTEVTEVKRAPDYDVNGGWTVTVKDTVTGGSRSEEFGGVMICVGHYNRPRMPSYAGIEEFKGRVMHTHALKNVAGFQKQNVLVVGNGCSGLDVAVEASSVAKQVYLSSRSGMHVINRVGTYGYPIDTFLLRRCFTWLLDILPINWASYIFEKAVTDQSFDRSLHRVAPKHNILSHDPTFNDHIASKLMSGSVIEKPVVARFAPGGVVFQGEDHVTEVDTVVMATGYTWKFPFLEDGVLIQEDSGRINLYKCMYPPQLKYSSLVFIGFLLPFGPGFPPGELQCRWAARMFSGKCHLPDEATMMEDVRKRHETNCKRFPPNERMSIRVDVMQYCDDIAKEIGAKPDFLKLLFTDFRLFLKLVFGPAVPYQYRLQGPQRWDGAREAIMTVERRIATPLNDSGKRRHGFMAMVYLMLVKFFLFPR